MELFVFKAFHYSICCLFATLGKWYHTCIISHIYFPMIHKTTEEGWLKSITHAAQSKACYLKKKGGVGGRWGRVSFSPDGSGFSFHSSTPQQSPFLVVGKHLCRSLTQPQASGRATPHPKLKTVEMETSPARPTALLTKTLLMSSLKLPRHICRC